MSVTLDYKARDLARLWPLLALPDADLIDALGGRRRAELHIAYDAWQPAMTQPEAGAQCICRHHCAYPQSLCKSGIAPPTLMVRGGMERLNAMIDQKIVAIVGAGRASDYGMETALGLARGLAAAGLTVASGLAEGIPAAVHNGALQAHGSTLTVTAGGVEHCSPAWCRGLYRRVVSDGCAISETITPSIPARRWWQAAHARTLALLAQLVIVVEAGERPWELTCARVAQAHGRIVAAVPGRVSSPASRGTNALLMEGARIVRNSQDALDLLYGGGVRLESRSSGECTALDPRLQAVLERVGDGADTLPKLAAQGCEPADAAEALAELELLGLLLRGDAGRYVPRSEGLVPDGGQGIIRR